MLPTRRPAFTGGLRRITGRGADARNHTNDGADAPDGIISAKQGMVSQPARGPSKAKIRRTYRF